MFSKKTAIVMGVLSLTASAALPAFADTETKTVVEKTNADGTTQWTTENQYWHKNYNSRPYYKKETDYSAYEPAYHYGVETYSKHPDRKFDDIDQAELRSGWEHSRGNSTMDWDQARDASRDAYTHVYETRTLKTE